MPDAIAIDFGTTRTKAAYWDAQAAQLRLVRLGYQDEAFLPSLFYLPRDSEEVHLGFDAEDMLEDDPRGIVEVLKRKLQDSYVFANRRKITPQALLIRMLSYLRERVGREVSAFKGQPPARGFLTLPALYGPAVERLLRKAGQAAGFAEVELVPEPVAAAQAWLAENNTAAQGVVVLDCGGGTLDLAYLSFAENHFRIVPECPPTGDTHVGGHDVDHELLNLVRENAPEAMEELEQRQPYYLQQLRARKERYCRGLPLQPLRVKSQRVSLADEDIHQVLTNRFVTQACDTLKAYLTRVSDLTKGNTPPVLLVGGSARIKGLKEALEEQCGCRALWWERSEFATVLGAVSIDPRLKPQPIPPAPQPPKAGTVFRDTLKDGSQGPEMVYLRGGTFKMGDSQGIGDEDERPVHEVTLDIFAIGRYPVTVGEFCQFVEKTGYKTEAERGDGAYVWDGKEVAMKSDANWRNPYFPQANNHPVACLSWNDAAAYCQWLSEQTGEQYSLPSEAQWEYACRASSGTAYCFGNDEQRLGDYAWYSKNAAGKTHPVGEKRPNDWQLYDMHGNVWEWVRDWYGDYSSEPQSDPSGPESGSYRVARGGGWVNVAGYCRSAYRFRGIPGDRLDILGFRLARKV